MAENTTNGHMAHARSFLTDEVRARGSKKRVRSRITNGAAFLNGVDQRSPWVRRARDVQAQLVQDRGGADVVSSAEALIMRRAAVLEAELERMEGIFAAAGEADTAQLGLYQTVANCQRRLLEAIGLERRARDVTPTLSEYAHQVEGSAA